MRYIKKILLTLLTLFVAGGFASAREPIVAAFKTAPTEVFPLIDKSVRLDMIDYFDSPNNVGGENALMGRSRIMEIVPGSMKISMTSASRYQIVILPKETGDTLVAVISTMLVPAPDSKIALFGSDWTPIAADKLFKRPLLKEWLTAAGKKAADQVEILVPFILVGYDFDPVSLTLTLTNNTSTFLSEEVYEIVKPYFLEKLVYRWNGKIFKLIK